MHLNTGMENVQELQDKVRRLERTVSRLQDQVEDLDLCYSMLLNLVERGVDSGSLKLDLSCFAN